MKHPFASVAVLASLALAQGAQAVEYNQVFPERSRLAFTYKQMGVPMQGGFKRFAAQLAFDPAKPETGQDSALSLDAASVDAGYQEANAEVVGKDWFNVKAFPTAGFVSSGVRALGGNRYEARGTLTIKGKARPVTAPFTLARRQGHGASLRRQPSC
jgi:polyisoprenoid-binding protein YceI